MSMSERRQKQKWTLNPRGKWWTEDSNKFGQRMLEKMGWTKGKGLGINEQGITEFSSMSYKSDITGMGYESVDAEIKHQEKFRGFLQQLNTNQEQDVVKKSVDRDASLSGQSIELKSKQSHTRVHYKKFTRGKDINKYRSKDLANIFGQKELVEETQIKIEKDDNQSSHETEASNRNDWYGVVTINGGNMVDYFKLKSNYNMTDYSKCNVKLNNDISLSSNTTDNRTTDFESENGQHINLGFTSKTESVSNYEVLKVNSDKSNYAFDNPCLGLSSPVETANSINDSSTKSKQKRKKEFESNNSHTTEVDKHNVRKKLKTETNDSDCKNGFVNPALNLDTKFEKDCNGKEFEVFRTQFGLENCALDLTDERNDKKRVTFNDHVMLYEYNINSTKRKKKGEVTLDKFEVENKKNKKKRKHENTTIPVTTGFVNEALDVQILLEEINDNDLNEYRNKKIKKRKICKTSSLETIQESPEKKIIEINSDSENNIVENGETDTVELKKKKKKREKEEKKVKDEDITILHVVNEESDIGIEEVISSKKSKKAKDNKEEEEGTAISKKCKKKKKKNNENCKNEQSATQIELNNDEQDIKILDKSKSKQQQNDYLIDSENKNVTIIETLPVPMTKEEEKPKQKKKKRKDIDKEDCSNEINVYNIETEISDKENTDKEEYSNTKKVAKKDKKSKKSKDKNVSNIEDSSNPNEEVVDINVIKQNEIENAEFTDTPSKKGKVIDAIDNIINSPWNVKARISKKMLMTLFHNNAILEFPGSNIHNIKGYGADIEYDL